MDLPDIDLYISNNFKKYVAGYNICLKYFLWKTISLTLSLGWICCDPMDIIQEKLWRVQILNKVKIDLILLDVELPKMSGLEVLKKIKTNPDTKNIRVVAFTGHSDPHHKQKFLEAGFYDVISKPINFKNFRFQIEKFLKE